MSTTISSTSLPSGMSIVTTSAASSTSTPGPSGGGAPTQQNGNGSIATSASLYLYTFLATLVLLLSVSAAIVIRSFILRRRHRLMVEEAIRNGTWVPPTPPSRPQRVDLSKKPMLWEAYIDDKGSVAALYASDGSSEGKNIQHDHWRSEHSRDWDTIKPFSAAYVTKTPEVVGAAAAIAANSTLSLSLNTAVPAAATGLGATPSATSIHRLGVPANDVSANPSTSIVATPFLASDPAPSPLPVPVTTPAPTPRTPRHRAFFSQAMRMLNPTPDQTSPLPAPAMASDSIAGGAEIAMAELKHNSTAPSMMRVAVLIAMPAPPTSVGSLSTSATSSSLSPSSSSLPRASPAHPLQPSTRPTVTPLSSDDDEHPLPHLEVGVAEVLMVPPEMSSSYPRGKVRDSVASQGSRDSDV